MAETVETALTKLLGIKYPIFLAGMGKAAGPTLAAAVTNCGGLGCIGGIFLSPRILRLTIKDLKSKLIDRNAPFGVDLLIPKIGGGARATNYDYTKGQLDELIDVIVESGAKLFICAIGVAPKHVVQKLHDNNILYMNMIGAPKHIKYAINAGCDILCCQGAEGGGHIGDIATTCLLPKCVDMVKKSGYKSPLTGQPIYCVGAGGIYDGRGLAMAFNYGAEAVWIGTRFVCSIESAAHTKHKQAIINASNHDTIKTEIYSGRPLRVIKNEYNMDWEMNRKEEMRKLLQSGIRPIIYDEKNKLENMIAIRYLSGQCCGNIHDIKSAKNIIFDMMNQCVEALRYNTSKIKLVSKL